MRLNLKDSSGRQHYYILITLCSLVLITRQANCIYLRHIVFDDL